VELSSETVSGPVIVGLRSSLPIKRIDLAGKKVEANLHVSAVPCSGVCNPVEAIFPACALTCAMAKRALNQVMDDNGEQTSKEVTVQLAEVSPSAPLTALSETSSELAPLKDDELEATVNSVLSAQMLVRKQKEHP